MSVFGREQRSWEDFKKEYLAPESIIQSLDMKPIRVHREKGSWRGKLEPCHLRLALWVIRTGGPRAAATDQREGGGRDGIPQQQSRFYMIESRNKNKTTTG